MLTELQKDKKAKCCYNWSKSNEKGKDIDVFQYLNGFIRYIGYDIPQDHKKVNDSNVPIFDHKHDGNFDIGYAYVMYEG